MPGAATPSFHRNDFSTCNALWADALQANLTSVLDPESVTPTASITQYSLGKRFI